jgi:hypothetical protein
MEQSGILVLITKIIKLFTSGTSYLMNGGYMFRSDDGPVGTDTCSLPFIKYDVPDENCFIILVIKLLAHQDVFNHKKYTDSFFDLCSGGALILGKTPTILTQNFHSLPQSIQANERGVQLRLIPPNSLACWVVFM